MVEKLLWVCMREILPANYYLRKSKHPTIVLIFAKQHEISHHITLCYVKQQGVSRVT